MNPIYNPTMIEKIRQVQALFAAGNSSRWIAQHLELDRQLVMSWKNISLPKDAPQLRVA